MDELSKKRPYLFVFIVFVLTLVIPLPFVMIYKLAGLDLVQLRLLIPIVESVFIVGLLWKLKWLSNAGFNKSGRDFWLLWFPTLLAFVPIAFFGTVKIPADSMFFYTLAIFFTGVSEEGFARGLGLHVLRKERKWRAVFYTAFLFGIGHVTNFFFTEFNVLEGLARLFTLMSFAILYGAVYLRVRNLWPLIILHTLWDLSLLISGGAGPFSETPMPLSFEIGVGTVSVVYAWIILKDSVVEARS